MERIKVPKMDVGLYFKKPDKYSIKSKNFAMIPKEALGFNILSILKDYQIKSLEKLKPILAHSIICFTKEILTSKLAH